MSQVAYQDKYGKIWREEQISGMPLWQLEELDFHVVDLDLGL